jgi:hypothetical protein
MLLFLGNRDNDNANANANANGNANLKLRRPKSFKKRKNYWYNDEKDDRND